MISQTCDSSFHILSFLCPAKAKRFEALLKLIDKEQSENIFDLYIALYDIQSRVQYSLYFAFSSIINSYIQSIS